ncbi:hypothetical protein GN956_G24086 [Arapaima gigas]
MGCHCFPCGGFGSWRFISFVKRTSENRALHGLCSQHHTGHYFPHCETENCFSHRRTQGSAPGPTIPSIPSHGDSLSQFKHHGCGMTGQFARKNNQHFFTSQAGR